jgi:hypothetical protein
LQNWRNSGFLSKSARLRLWGWIWATGSKSSGQDLMRVGVLGLTGMSRSDQRRGAIWAAGWGIDGPDLAQAAAAAGCGWRRGKAAAQRRRAAAQRPHGARVHCWLRVLHQNIEHARANSTGTSRGGGDDAQRRMADSGGGGAPAKTSRRRGARTSKPTAPEGSLHRGGSSEQLQATGRRRDGGERRGIRATVLDELGLGGGG